MRKSIFRWSAISAAACLLGMISPAQATIVYNNSTNDLVSRFAYAGNEIGDEIVLGGSERYLTDFSFEFFGTNLTGASTFSGTPEGMPEVKVRFYLNDGPQFSGYSSPSNSFFESGWFPLGATTPRSTLVFDTSDFGAGGLFMPVVSNFTWSVQFRNLGVDDQVGLDLYDPPTVGQSYNDYWEFSGGTWVLKSGDSVPVNFGAVFAAVPEPSTLGMFVLGGLGLAAATIRSRRK